MIQNTLYENIFLEDTDLARLQKRVNNMVFDVKIQRHVELKDSVVYTDEDGNDVVLYIAHITFAGSENELKGDN